MGKKTGFMEYARELGTERDPEARLNDWHEFHGHADVELLQRQGARCMDCGVPFCHSGLILSGAAMGCPINNLIPEWNDLVYRGEWEDALARLLKTNNFP
ncbi:MAG: glutamate synthase, partial [Acidobacteria bacterium]